MRIFSPKLFVLAALGLATAAAVPRVGYADEVAPAADGEIAEPITEVPSTEELSVAQIIDAVDGPPPRRMCLSLGGRPCDSENPCAVHQRWEEVLDLSRSHIEGLTIAHLIGEQTDAAVSPPSSQVGQRNRTDRAKERKS